MLELSQDKSKHLINVENRPFLAYLLDNIIDAGYKEIIMVVGYREDMIKEFLKNYKFQGTQDYKIDTINQHSVLGPKEKEYGTACPIKCAKNLVGNEPFVSIVGDNFYSVDDLRAMRIDDNYNYVAGLEHKEPEKFGVLLTSNDGFLQKIVEKPKEFVGNMVNSSLYKFTPEIFDKVFQIEKSPRGEYEITDAISLLARENKVKTKKMNGFWMDFGKPDDISKFSEFLRKEQKINENNKVVAESA